MIEFLIGFIIAKLTNNIKIEYGDNACNETIDELINKIQNGEILTSIEMERFEFLAKKEQQDKYRQNL